MGGDLFQGVQKLSNQEYEEMTTQLMQKLSPFCERIEPYIPLPQKQIHGDIDFVVLKKNNFGVQKFIQFLQPTLFKINNDNGFNIVYKNKQVDFVLVDCQKYFDLMHFYKSYSGFGGYLGVFFQSKILKVTHKGLFATVIHYHLKMEFLVSDSVQKIMEFYGLNYQRHKKGYKTRRQLYQYLREVRFLDEQKYIEQVKLVKGTSKLMWGMVEYLKQNGVKKQKKVIQFEQPLKEILGFFNKTQQFDIACNNLFNKKKRQQQMSKKFNAIHILDHFDIVPKQVDKLKEKFISLKFDNDKQKYLDYVENHTVDQLLQVFGLVCELKTKSQTKPKLQKDKS